MKISFSEEWVCMHTTLGFPFRKGHPPWMNWITSFHDQYSLPSLSKEWVCKHTTLGFPFIKSHPPKNEMKSTFPRLPSKYTHLRKYRLLKGDLHGFPRKPEHFFSSKSSWTPETQPNDAYRRHLVEFLVFNSVFGRWRSLKSTYYIMNTIYFLQSLEKVPRQHPLTLKIS